ncbi:hypothetical protein BT63DRAFT_463958 [Microthyrium microscopicum]|uniref:Protein sip5 n=1 Tax=Microthyrium microscopicum TaxID=703497 RepID=A0A6A6U4A8_9PEZI|nr:hypothetical protein BT63DRAFT_463958 [Microthyrium microscopicum]
MGNHPSKERPRSPTRGGSGTHTANALPTRLSPHHAHTAPPQPNSSDRQSERPSANRRRSSRPDLNIFNIGNRPPDINPDDPAARRETKPEREARKLEKERAQRAIDRDRSVREEGVDGGYLVTLGTYTGTEDFSKPTVRRLMIERKLAPFWKGINDHSESWKDNQLVAISKGLPLPEAQENIVYPGGAADPARSQCADTPNSSHLNIHSQPISIPAHPSSPLNDTSSLSPSHPAFSPMSSSNLMASSTPDPPTKSPLFRGRAKTLASLASLSRGSSSQEIVPQEKQLPRDPYFNGQPVEAFLYKDAIECPICFLYYPPYLNSTRCCDQPICSECFVQIKRPDPHPPEHGDPTEQASSSQPQTQPDGQPDPTADIQLVSEPATCPFCKTPELGITYEPPPFRRGLVHANLTSAFKSAMSSSSSINSQGVHGHSRRRNTSISADSPNVITTDRVRPEWAKKLADARAQAFKRAAAATALHNAAYMMDNMPDSGNSRFLLGRRRRTMFGGEGNAPLQLGQVGALLAAADRQQAIANGGEQPNQDLFPGRGSSRRSRIDDLEELMMMEAIRQSIQAEEERKKKEDKDAAKAAKKEEKQRQKGARKGSKGSWIGGLQLGSSSSSQLETGEPSNAAGKGKATANHSGDSSVSPSLSPSSDEIPRASAPNALPDQNTGLNVPDGTDPLRQLSINNSSASSFSDMHHERQASSFEFGPNGSAVSLDTGTFNSETPPGSATGEPVLSFRSLDEVIGDEAPGSVSPSAQQSQILSGSEVQGSTLANSEIQTSSEVVPVKADMSKSPEPASESKVAQMRVEEAKRTGVVEGGQTATT